MATLLKRKSKKTGKTLWTVQVALDRQGRRRPTIPLGSLSKSNITTAKTFIEALAASKRAGLPIDGPVADWLGTVSEDLYARLAKIGLCPPRQYNDKTNTTVVPTIATFIDNYIDGRKDIKANTARNLRNSRGRLVDYFGDSRLLTDITPGDCDEWRQSLVNSGLATATISKAVKHAKQFLRLAQRKGLVASNPFVDLRAGGERNDLRLQFIVRAVIERVIDTATDAQWRLIIALSRYGGLRCPSEHLGLRWSDIDWERGRFVVRAPKTERHQGKRNRVVPLFPELRPYLEAVRDEANPGIDCPLTTPVITRYRDSNANLRTQLLRFIERAGVKKWQRAFHNLRASRQTELADHFPAHVVAAWLGNSPTIAERHYLQTIETHYEKACNMICAAKTLQQQTAMGESNGIAQKVELRKPPDIRESAKNRDYSIPPRGFEPLSPP